MLQVLIVEDEIRICKMIRYYIKWDELGLQLAGETYDGMSAYAAIKEKHPDIVITDIRLPGISGIDLISRANELEKVPLFIIISGHKEFEYAHTALKYGVEDYLIKPVNGDEINQALCHAAAKIQREQKMELSDLRNTFPLNIEQHQQLLAQSLIMGSFISGNWEDFQQTYVWNTQILTVFTIRLFDNINYPESYPLVTRNVGEATKNFFGESGCSIASQENDIICVVPLDLSDPIEKPRLESLCELITRQLYPFDQISFVVGIGPSVIDPSQLTPSFTQSQYALGGVLLQGSISLFFSSSLPKDIAYTNCLKNLAAQQQIVIVVEKQSENELEKLIGDTISLIKDTNGYQLILSQILVELFDAMINYAHNYVERLNDFQQIRTQTLTNMKRCCTERSLIQAAKVGMKDFLSELRTQYQKQESSAVNIARQYVRDHYMEYISLEGVANIVFLNPSYFSTLFKKETGENFLDYVTDVRMKHARRLLSERQWNVSEVALMVGYKDPKYFSKQFYKLCGIKPQDYKKLHAKRILHE